MTSKIKSEEGPLNMDCIYHYTASLQMGKRGVGREDVLVLLYLCWPPVNLLGALGSLLQSGTRCQASGFSTSVVLFSGSNSLV